MIILNSRNVLLLVTLLMVFIAAGESEEKLQPFSQLYMEASAGEDIVDNAIDKFWTGARPWGIAVTTNFYVGEASLGVLLQDFTGRASQYPDFENRYFYLRWGQRIPLFSFVSMLAAGEVGVSQMEFEPNRLYPNQEEVYESELTTTLLARLMFNARYLHPWVGVGYQSILTQKRVEQIFISAGLEVRTKMPGWLSRILR